MTQQYTITLIAGDWSHDGHNATQTYNISSNLTQKEIEKAYKKGVKKIGVNLTEDVCADYEMRHIQKEDWDKFITSGFVHGWNKKQLNSYTDEFGIELACEEFLKLYLHTVYCGNNNFEYTILKDNSSIHIGGYGLLGN
jgi:hypothetical protein